MTLTNLSFANSPLSFPKEYQYYPCVEQTIPPTEGGAASTVVNCNVEQQFFFPWFTGIDFLKNDLEWTMFFSIDV
jgi:hypothetical protein